MKVILNVDVKSLGEEGDVKNVANGYARNFLLPRNLAVPYNEATVAIFEARKAEIEARKEQKRKDSEKQILLLLLINQWMDQSFLFKLLDQELTPMNLLLQ